MADRVPIYAAGLLVLVLFALAACAGEVERPKTPTPTLAATPTATIVPTATPTATLTQTPTATTLPVPAATASPTATPAPTPSPAAIPVATRTATQTPVPKLFLNVHGPADGTTVRNNAAVVHGVTIPTALVNINGEITAVSKDGSFQAEVTLLPGANLIEVVATDATGNREIKSLTVTFFALPRQPFFLLITHPQDQSIVTESPIGLSGRTAPDAIVSVNGVSVPVDPPGTFSTTVTLEPGPNIIDVVATSTDGQVLSAVIAVILRP